MGRHPGFGEVSSHMEMRCMGKPLKACGILLAAVLGSSPLPAAAQTSESPTAAATATIRGRITDAQSHEPIGQADVTVIRTALHAYTEDDGRYLLERVPAGACTLSVTRMGYA